MGNIKMVVTDLDGTLLRGDKQISSQTEAVLQQLRKQGVLMLRACGTGVAVSNALAEVKEAADVVCLSNEEDGVALWLAEHVLREDCVSKKFGMVKIKEY